MIDDQLLKSLREYVSGDGMPDMGQIGTYSGDATDSFNQPIRLFTWGSIRPCRFTDNVNRTDRMNLNQLELADAMVHFPSTVLLNGLDRVRITSRWGSPVTPEEYETIGTPAVHALEIVAKMKKVTSSQ